MKKYTTKQMVCVSGFDCGTEIEISMLIEFTVRPSCDASDYSPAEEASIEDVSVTWARNMRQVPVPAWIENEIVSNEGFRAWLLEEASVLEDIARDQAADLKRDERSWS